MRTVTFSDAKVAAALSKNCVSTWRNIRPEKKFRERPNEVLDQLRDRNPRKELLGEGAGDTNICAIFALPDGRIVHAVQGYARPARFSEEIEFALEAAKAARGEDAVEALKSLYGRRMRNLDGEGESVRGTLAKLASSPLPSIRDIMEAKSAGLR
jgi:hypothetical protein